MVRAAFVAVDLFSLIIAAAVAYVALWVIYGLLGVSYADAWKIVSERWPSFALSSTLAVFWLYTRGHHHARMAFWEEAGGVVAVCAGSLMIEGFLLYANKADASRLSTFVTWFIAPFLVMSARSILKAKLRSRGFGIARTLVVGRDKEAAAVARVLSSDQHMGYVVCGFAGFSNLVEITREARQLRADTVVLALSGADSFENTLASSIRQEGLNVVLAPPLPGIASAGARMQYVIGQDAVLIVDRPEVLPRLSRLAKRSFDVAVAGSLLGLASLPMLVVAALVRGDGGPAIYGHERVGAEGRKFKCLKFRSMAVDADERLERLLHLDSTAREEWERFGKLRNDPRVTALGRFIRKSAIDELPQLINVIKGDMSLVGPRPVTEGELLQHYGAVTSLYGSVRPGLTGLWQVSGRNDVSYEERVALDTWYVRNWSPWHDIAILLKTVPALLSRRGAY